VSLALSTLLYEWRRYMAAVIALAVAGLLVLALCGMFTGVAKSFSAMVDRSPAEIMILPPKDDNLFANSDGQPRRVIPEIYQHPDVTDVQTLTIGFALWTNFPKDGEEAKSDGVQIIIVDPVHGAITLPTDINDDQIAALQIPYSVVIDKSALTKLGVQVGDRAKLNGNGIWVRGTTTGYATMFNAQIFMSHQTAKLLHLDNDGPRVGALMVKIRDPSRTQQVTAELNAMGNGQYKAWTRAALAEATQRSMLAGGGISVIIGFAAVVGLFIGIVITWQTLQGAILANIKEFASLRALGVSMGSLRLVIIELSFWVGIAGLLFTVLLTAGVAAIAKTFSVPMSFPLFIDLPVGITLLIVALLSGLFSLGILRKSQPAELLR
jgi:putative ABC transport system permease protein